MSTLRAKLALGLWLVASPAVASVGQVAALEGMAVRVPKDGVEQPLATGSAADDTAGSVVPPCIFSVPGVVTTLDSTSEA